jgi:hypothetical protein
VRPLTWKVNSATGGAEGETIGRLSRPTLTPTWASTFATPGASPAKNSTVAAPFASGLLMSRIGLPETSVPKLPRLVLSETSVPSAGMTPSLLFALTVSRGARAGRRRCRRRHRIARVAGSGEEPHHAENHE